MAFSNVSSSSLYSSVWFQLDRLLQILNGLILLVETELCDSHQMANLSIFSVVFNEDIQTLLRFLVLIDAEQLARVVQLGVTVVCKGLDHLGDSCRTAKLTVYGCDVAEHAVRRNGGGDGVGQTDLSLSQLVLVREE